MTFKLNQRFNQSLATNKIKSSNAYRTFAKESSINETQELQFDISKINLNFNQNIQSELILGHANHGNRRNAEIKDIFAGYFEYNRNSELIAHIGRFQNGGREGLDKAICPLIGLTANLAVTAAATAGSGGTAAPVSPWLGRVVGVGAGWACAEVMDLFSDDVATTDTPQEEEEPGSTPGSKPETPGSKPENESEEKPENESEEKPENESEERPENDQDDSGNDQDGSESDDGQNDDGQNSNPTEESNNPMDEGQGGNDEESNSSVDADSNINWGPDGQSGGDDDSSYGGPIDQLDPITNWGPDGKDGEAQFGTSIGTGILDPHTNWNNERSDMYVISDFSEVLGNIDPTHNGSDDDQTNFVDLMAAAGDNLF